MRRLSLYETIALTATLLFLLQLGELKLTKWLKYILKIVLCDGKVNVANIKAVERDAVGLGGHALGIPSLTILLCFSELRNDRNADQFLSRELNGLLH